MRKNILTLLLFPLLLSGCSGSSLPIAEATDGYRGEMFGIDKNINEATIDKYLNRSDTVYRDMRMLVDPANYEAIGGDSYLSGIIKGYEVVPLPYLIPAVGLPEEVGESYQGLTLYRLEGEHFVPNYVESLDVLEFLFPKDKNIFLMCGGAGYSFMTKTLLVDLGWNGDHIYNTGGYWYYDGPNSIEIKRVNENDEVVYDFYKLNYHDINFANLIEL